ncbi:unnamed protein product [Adineta steineri]|uniref:BZIP domain-containing protein n=1 Tax=Adineta steineri TaxID=433720 RepID=A0A815QWW8_9BILA|nr:unnamed protein product [Adineta steineri]
METPNILDTPSLMTPNLSVNQLFYKPSNTTSTNDHNDNDNNNQNSTANRLTITTTTTTNDDDGDSFPVSSAEIKLLNIENDLKQIIHSRQPTESPFQKIVKAGGLTIEKNTSLAPTQDDGLPVDIPSTAEVMNDIESFGKYPTRDNVEREVTVSDSNRLDTSPTHNMGVIVSPKKQFLRRSQSHTEATSPTNHLSQLNKLNHDDENSIDDDNNNNFQRMHDLPILTHTIDSNSQIDNNIEPSYPMQFRSNQNGVHPTIIKQQQPVILNNKRTLSQAIITTAAPKANSIVISQPAIINEVTSSDQSSSTKRLKIISTSNNTIGLRSSFSSSSNDNNSQNDNNNGGSDDQRKKQIRDSNREAARRCRERRRNYIEQLEGNLEQCKSQIKQLSDNLARAERENTQLRAILTETKIFHSSTRPSQNESNLDFSSIISTTNGIDLNSESTDGNIIQRNYITRHPH